MAEISCAQLGGLTPDHQHQHERKRAGRQPGQHHLGGTQPLQTDLDEKEARAPDEGQGDEADQRGPAQGPTSDERTWLRARSRMSRLTAFR